MRTKLLLFACFFTVTLAKASMIYLMIDNTTPVNQTLTVTSNDTLYIGNGLSSLWINSTYMSGPGTTLLYPCTNDSIITIWDGTINYYSITNSSLATGISEPSGSNTEQKFIYDNQTRTIKAKNLYVIKEILIYDLSGKVVVHEKDLKSITLNVKPGLYIISGNLNDKTLFQKIVIQ